MDICLFANIKNHIAKRWRGY